MKCSKCGYEFGEGVTCQHCGVDRVTGLGNYSGYSPNEDPYNSGGRNKNGSVSGNNYTVKSNTMICYKCGEIIPADSKFCPHCSINLYVTCPKCGYEYSSQYPACSKCGTNREKYNEQIWKEEERQREWREAERKRQEEEKKRREEWEKSPEGQAELERKRKEKEEARKLKQKAEIIKKECEQKSSRDSNVRIFGLTFSFGMAIVLCVLLIEADKGDTLYSHTLTGTLLFLLDLALFFFGVYCYVKLMTVKDYVKEYIKSHPNDPVIKYLH